MNNSSKWHKTAVTKQQIEPLCSRFGLSPIQASVMIRRGITQGNELLYYLEDDMRFQHSPFLFSSMEDAVERILQAKDEGEKILIFGDSDVDGITSTAILYEYLSSAGFDVQWRLPLADDGYGLSLEAVDAFAKQDGTLIITVDCGISNFEEIAHASELGIDVIVTDHHNPPETLPQAIIILDPKLEDSFYPFADISGAAVSYKLVSALRFAETAFYNAEICILDVQETQNDFSINCIKIRNLVKVKELHETIIPGKTSIYDLKLVNFLTGQLIYAWDVQKTQSLLQELFGSGVQFNLYDLKSEISKVIPSLKNCSANQLKELSVIAKYNENANSDIESLFNLYVTYCKKIIAQKKSEQQKNEKLDIQLVALAALADIMPMKNENRLFVKNGILSIKNEKPRPGLAELFNKLKLNPATITSIDLSWTVIPALNAAGRMGKSNLALELLISKDPSERENLADTIFALNEERKNLVSSAVFKIQDKAKESIEQFNGNLCLCVDECINKGVTGIVAARLMGDFNVPSIAITFCEGICVGSMRSSRGFIATDFLDSLGDIFINHGGHDFAAGFSFKKENLDLFVSKVKAASSTIQLNAENDLIEIDAEVPPQFLEPELFKLIDLFEPYGCENAELVLMTKQFTLCDAMIVGKKEPQHLKLVFDTGKHKIPAMFWGQAERLKKDICIGQKYDILYSISHNYFNGIITNQLIIKDLCQI